MPIRSVIRAIRTPALLAIVALSFMLNKALMPNLMITLQDLLNGQLSLNLWVIRPDYFFYVPNQLVMVGYLLGAFVLLEMKRAILPQNHTARQDVITVFIGLGYALSMLPWMHNLRFGIMQMLLSGAHVGLLWLFVVANAGLGVVERWMRERPWVNRLLEWTFPVSDLFFYVWHRQRIGDTTSFRWLPSGCYVLALLLALGAKAQMLWGAIRAERLDVPVEDAQYGMVVEDGVWFTNGNMFDVQSGIWFYSERSKTGQLVIRTSDCRQFYFKDGSFYLHDRYDHYVRKVDATTREVLWKVPVGRMGTFQVVGRDGLMFAAGEGGYILSVTEDGEVLAKRTFYPLGTWVPQAVWGGQVAWLSGDERVHFRNSRLTAGESISLPLPRGVRRFVWDEAAGRSRSITNWTDYDRSTETLYVQTLWGEIYRYDVKHRQWRPSIKARPGVRSITVDSDNGLLFAWNYYGGFIEIFDVTSRQRVGYILANAFGRYMNLDPVRMVGVAGTHGHGVWRFDYRELVRRRDARHARLKEVVREGPRPERS